MNAAEARTKAQSINTKKQNDQYNKIKIEVDKSVDGGGLKTIISESLYTGVRIKLLEEGFKISSFDGGQRDGITTTISW